MLVCTHWEACSRSFQIWAQLTTYEFEIYSNFVKFELVVCCLMSAPCNNLFHKRLIFTVLPIIIHWFSIVCINYKLYTLSRYARYTLRLSRLSRRKKQAYEHTDDTNIENGHNGTISDKQEKQRQRRCVILWRNADNMGL